MLQQRTRRVASAGFTLIELLVVMVILAVLAAAVIPRVVDARRMPSARAPSRISSLGIALDMSMRITASIRRLSRG